MSCPLAAWRHDTGIDRNPSFGVYVHEKKPSRAFCFSCGFTGDLMDVVLEIKQNTGKSDQIDFKQAMRLAEADGTKEGLELAYYTEAKTDKDIYFFNEHWLSSFMSCVDSEDGLNYCLKRGVPTWVVRELGLVYDSSESRVCFPIRDFDGRLVGLHGRSTNDNVQPVYRMYTDTYPVKGGRTNPDCWFGESTVQLDYPVVVVESVFDYARVYEVYKNVVCPLTASVNERKILRLQDSLFLIKMMDADKAGRSLSYKLKKTLLNVPQKDIYLPEGKDPADLTSSQVRKYIKSVLN